MKKLTALILASLLLLSFCACGSLNAGSGDDTTGKNTDKSEVTVDFNGDTVVLDYETHHKDMFFNASIVDFYTNTAGSLCNLSYRHDGDVTYIVNILYFEGKSIEEAMEGTEAEFSDKTVNGINYKYFETAFQYTDATLPGHVYIYNFDGTTYTINFISSYDLTSLETGFLNTVHFEKSE